MKVVAERGASLESIRDRINDLRQQAMACRDHPFRQMAARALMSIREAMDVHVEREKEAALRRQAKQQRKKQ